MIESKFNYKLIERKIYNFWLEQGYFNPDFSFIKNSKKKSTEIFSMVIPPPNVTGRLHMGHALNNTIQDIIVRYNRMLGKQVLWLPGTDHAGIATQTMVKKQLYSKNIDYQKLGREKFVEKIWEWKRKFGGIILDQIKALGSSCDWSRTKFTMDKDLALAVNHAFKKLYDDGLIYKGKRMVNWCPIDKTALSDDEIEKKEEGEIGYLYDIKYALVNQKGFIVVSTTRPETLFGDTAVAVNPQDKRYQKLIGNEIIVPLQKRNIKIIADDYVKMDFGTGCLKVTPAHDPHDFELGIRHGLEFIEVMDENATMNDKVPQEFYKLDRFECRKKVLKELRKNGLLLGENKRMIPLGRSYRSKAIIEYRLSNQWFIKMQPLAKKLIAKSQQLNFFPSFYKKVWFHWLENIKDWCISRQIWWGHQIPAWINQETNQIVVDVNEPDFVKKDKNWKREEDVLDTWFSSALWPLSTLGWPDKNNSDFKFYFPTTSLSTAKDIIFFWVVRMCLFSLFFEKKLPFKNIYFHPTVMDSRGKVMSKSKGNGIDPFQIINGATVDDLQKPVLDARPSNMLEMLDEIKKNYSQGFIGVGADALRFTLIYLFSNKQFIQLSLENFINIGRKFTNKLWNSARLLLLEVEKLKGLKKKKIFFDLKEKSIFFLWMNDKLNQAIKKIKRSFDHYEFSNLGEIYYELIWNNFCNWYLEFIKQDLKDDLKKITVLSESIFLLKRIITSLHPITPFITEEINFLLSHKLKDPFFSDPLIISQFPEISEEKFDLNLLQEVELIKKIIFELRSYRKTNNLHENEKVEIYFFTSNSKFKQQLIKFRLTIIKLANLKSFTFTESKLNHLSFWASEEVEFYFKIPHNDLTQKNKDRIVGQVEIDIAFLKQKLNNQNFILKANPKVVNQFKSKLEKQKEKLNKLLKS